MFSFLWKHFFALLIDNDLRIKKMHTLLKICNVFAHFKIKSSSPIRVSDSGKLE